MQVLSAIKLLRDVSIMLRGIDDVGVTLIRTRRVVERNASYEFTFPTDQERLL